MSEINANIVVETVGLSIDQQDPGINIQPEVINMTLYTAGYANPGGNVGDLQYNAGGFFDGIPFANYSNSNLTLGNVNEVKLLGGSNAYFLQTDGTGNLTWASGTVSANGNGTSNGANTQIQMSDGTGNFVGAAGFTFDYIANSLAVPGQGIFTGNIQSGNANLGNAATANYFIGNGSLLTGINTNIISNGSSNVKIPSLNGNVTISVDGTSNVAVFANNTVNITANLNVIGNIDANNVDGGNLVTANYLTGTLTTNAQPNITSVGTLTSLTVSGNINAGNITGIFANGNSNIDIPAANGNVNISVAGNSNILVATGTGVNIAGTLNVTGNTLLQSLRTKDTQIALGNTAQGVGPTGTYAIAIGVSAGETNQGQQAIAIGESAGDFDQSTNAIAIGTYAGLTSQGANAIAIGAGAGNFQQHSNSIIINATGANISSDGANRFFVKPIRNANVANILYYNQSTGEISYDVPGTTFTTLQVNGNANITGTANITTVNATNVSISGTGFVQSLQEKITVASAALGASYNYDLINQSIVYNTANANANITLNFRGNSTVTANTYISNANSIVATFIMTTGSPAYGVTAVQIDGSARTINWAGNTVPNIVTNTTLSYTFTLLKTGSNTYTVLGSQTRYG